MGRAGAGTDTNGAENGPNIQINAQERIVGINYGPFRDEQSPLTRVFPSMEQMREDMVILKRMAHYIRTYSVSDGLEVIPPLAEQEGLKVVPTAWLGRQTMSNQTEVGNIINVATRNDNVVFVVVGSEVLLRGDLPKADMIAHIQRVKASVSVPVTTSEPWHIWRDNPDLANAVDLIFVNIHPYWDGQSIEGAVGYVLEQYHTIKRRHPTKRVVISETGWPSGGPTKGGAVPSLANQKGFIQEFTSRAFEQNVEFFLFEAFDETWKAVTEEGEVGSHWGFYTSDRSPKHNFGTLQPTISGTVTLQGRTATFPVGVGHSIATVSLTPGGATANVGTNGSFQLPNVAAGTYTLTASAPGYVSTMQTNLVVPKSQFSVAAVQLRCGLVNDDNRVDIVDVTATADSFGKTVSARVDAQGRFVDQNGNGVVEIDDVTCVASNFGVTSPQIWP